MPDQRDFLPPFDDYAKFKADVDDKLGTLFARVATLGAADTAWHVVGGAGQPAFANGWANVGGAYAGAAFRKLSSGLVAVRGTVTGGSAGAAAFVLPAGYRPAAKLTFAVDANSAYGRVDVDASGNVLAAVVGATTNVAVNVAFFADA